jgi:hypothetical protein
MCRLIEGEESETLKEVYQKYFVDRGETQGDPFLVSIGRWQNKEYLKAVNVFQADNSK